MELFFPEKIEDEPFYQLIKELQKQQQQQQNQTENTNKIPQQPQNNQNTTETQTNEKQTNIINPDQEEEEANEITTNNNNIENVNEHQAQPQLQKQNNCDTAFFAYVKEFYPQTNYDYFHFLLKFVVMFRQCINKLKKSNNNIINSTEASEGFNSQNYFTQLNNAEGVPDMCNDFVTEFMEPMDYFGMDTMELIEIIQHFCHWLFLKNYTTSRLTLV